jgi:hypothetical protein
MEIRLHQRGVSRRSVLRAGTLALGGLGLADLLRREARADDRPGEPGKDLSVILLWQAGGPPHLDMWDLKPEAPAEIRGAFRPIRTSLPGYQVCEHLPRTAKVCDRLAILRSVTHSDTGHESATHLLQTGSKPANPMPANETPCAGSIVAKELGPRVPGFPSYVAIPRANGSSAAAYLGAAYNAFETQGDPNRQDFKVRNLTAPNSLTTDRLQSRRELLQHFDGLRRDADSSGVMEGMDAFHRQAFELITSTRVRDAFDLGREDEKLRDRYGRHLWGQSALLARRLVESGVRFVTVELFGWDNHVNNFEELHKQLPPFDQAYAALIEDLDRRGRLDRTLVLVWGEFGRTPRINGTAGRDHWPGVFTVVLAGGGLRRGIVVGESDARGEFPKHRHLSPQDVLATLYQRLGIRRDKTYVNEAGRPVEILNVGSPIQELL